MNDSERKEFADQVLAGLRERGEDGFAFDEAAFAIKGPQGQHFLGFLYSETESATESQRNLVVERAVENTLRARDANAPVPEQANRLVPVLAARTFYEHVVPAQLAAAAGDDLDAADMALEHVVVGGHLAVGLAIDHDTQIQYVTETGSLGLDFARAYEHAIANLRRSRRPLSLHSPGVYVAASDDYDAAHLLLVDTIRALPLRGDPVAVVPCRGFFLVTGSEDVAGLAVLAREVQSRIQSARPITSFAFRLRPDDTWEHWMPPGNDGGSALLRDCARRELAQLYNEQRERIEALDEWAVDDEGIFYASVKEIVGAEFRTLSTWTAEVRTLLPETDYVAINVGAPFLVAWERFRAICGSALRRRDDLYPVRWQTIPSPNERELAELRQNQTSPPRPDAPAPAPRDRRAQHRTRLAKRPLVTDLMTPRREIPFIVWILLACAILGALYFRFVS